MVFFKYVKVFVCLFMVLGITTSAPAGDLSGTRSLDIDMTSKQGKIQSGAGPYDHLAGKWIINDMDSFIAEFRVNGQSLTGTVDVNLLGPEEIKDGKIEGNKVSFNFGRRVNDIPLNSPYNASWKGIVVNKEIHFSVIIRGESQSFIARREGAKSEPFLKEEIPLDSTGPYAHLSGRWKANTMSGLMLMDFRVEGNKVTGSVGNKEMRRNKIEYGKVENNKISLFVKSSLMNRIVNGVWEGTIAGDKIRFTTQVGGTRLNFIAKKMEFNEEGNIKEVLLPPTVDPSGTWVLNVNGTEYRMAFIADGMSLVGVINQSPLYNTKIISDGKISGDTISFLLIKEIGPNLFLIPWEGKVTGEEIHFEGAPFNQFRRVTARKVEARSRDSAPVKLVREEEIKNSKVNKKYEKLRKKDSEYDAAMAYFDQYQYQLALPLMEKLYTRLPKDAVLLHRLGVCMIMQSIYPSEIPARREMRERARGLLEEAKERGMENELLEYYLKVIPEGGGEDGSFSKRYEVEETMTEAEVYFALSDLHKCIGLYARAMEMDPHNYKAVLYIGDSYFANGQHMDAAEWFERAAKMYPDKETAWRYWGDSLMGLDKKDEGRSKFIDALIAEPYNRLSWNGVRNLIKSNKTKFKTPDIQRPERIEASGELLAAEKNANNSNVDSPSDGTEAWSCYNDVVKEWRSTKFKEKFPEDKEYRNSLEAEKEALDKVASKVNEGIKTGRIKPGDLNPGIKTLLELYASGLLEPYILFHQADKNIKMEYPIYRKSNRDKLEQYLDRFEVPKIGDRQEL